MQRQIIITDLTRFKGDQIVCTAGVDYNTMECIRPQPYLQKAACERLNILPGGILSGDFEFKNTRGGPHMEDSSFKSLKFHGAASAETFREVLVGTRKPSIVEGFGIDLPDGDRGIPPEHQLRHSIFTLQVDPRGVAIVPGYKDGTLKLQFSDASGRFYRNFPITDLGFHNFAQGKQGAGDLEELNDWIYAQREVFLRIGLSGLYQPPNQKNAYWMQANGIYTFPDAPPGIRIHPQ